MFTGIVQQLGRVAANAGSRIRIDAKLGRLPLGASVSINGVCLTVVRRVAVRDGRKAPSRGRKRRSPDAGAVWTLDFEVSSETLRLTNLGDLKPGDPVNLEPALTAADPIGGHWVSGHVDARARVLQVEQQPGGFCRMRFALPASLARLAALKGSISVDGTSLTISGVGRDWFDVALIPHTLERTTLGVRKPGDWVNLEADLLARYLERLLDLQRPAKRSKSR